MRARLFQAAVAAAVLTATAVPASANRSAADACAARLPADAKLIYTATIGSVGSASNLADTVRSKARELVMSGRLSRDQAPAAAQAAGTCLKQAM